MVEEAHSGLYHSTLELVDVPEHGPLVWCRTPQTSRDVVITSRLTAVNLYFTAVEKLMFELSVWRCSDDLKVSCTLLGRCTSCIVILHLLTCKGLAYILVS